jgi:hypothetical protein
LRRRAFQFCAPGPGHPVSCRYHARSAPAGGRPAVAHRPEAGPRGGPAATGSAIPPRGIPTSPTRRRGLEIRARKPRRQEARDGLCRIPSRERAPDFRAKSRGSPGDPPLALDGRDGRAGGASRGIRLSPPPPEGISAQESGSGAMERRPFSMPADWGLQAWRQAGRRDWVAGSYGRPASLDASCGSCASRRRATGAGRPSVRDGRSV